MLHRYTMLFGCLLLSTYGFTQEIEPTRHLTTSDGLPSNTVYDIKEDKQGFIWFGTENGLSRFNGKKFINYGIDDGLKSLDVLELLIDKKNRIWLSTLDQSFTYFLDGEIHHLSKPTFAKSSSEPQGAYATGDSLVFYRTNKTIILSVEDLSTISILNTVSDKDYRMHGIKKSQGKHPFSDLYKGELVFYRGSDRSIRLLDTYNSTSSKWLSIHDELIQSLNIGKLVESIEHQNKLYVRTDDGLYIFDLTSHTFDYTQLLPQHEIARYTKTKNDDLWIATHNSGVFQFSSSTFDTRQSMIGEETPIKQIVDICTGDNVMVIASNKMFHFYTNTGMFIKSIALPPKYSNQTINKVKYFNKHFYIKTSQCLLKYFYFSNSFEQIIKLNNTNLKKESTIDFKDYLMRNDSTIILCYDNVFEIVNKEVVKDTEIPGNPRITTVSPYRDSMLLVGTLHGAYIYKYSARDPLNKISDIQDATVVFLDSDSSGNVYCIYFNGRVNVLEWKDGGLVEKGEKEKTFTDVNFNDATISDNELCIASSNGLMVFSIPDLTLLHHPDEIAGKANWNIQFIESFGDHHFVASSRQFAMINTESIDQPEKLNIFIDQIEVNNEIINNEKSVFNYDEQGIKISYSAPYFGKSNLQYEYKLDHHDVDFTRSSDAKTSYANLNAGDYVFKVRARVSEAVTSNEATYAFTILPPWWRTWWFYTLCTITGVGVAYYFYRDSKKKNQARLSLLQQRLNALHAQMNPHFLFNGLQSLQYYIATNDSKKAMTYLTSFANLVRKTLESSAHDFISVADEIDYLKSYLALEKEKLDENLTFDLVITDDTLLNELIPSMVLQPFVENAMVHGFQNRKEKNEIIISFKKLNAKQVACVISDNGKGIVKKSEKKENHKSFATNAIKAKLKLLDQLHSGSSSAKSIDIKILNHVEMDQPKFNTGMTVHLILPLIKNAQLN